MNTNNFERSTNVSHNSRRSSKLAFNNLSTSLTSTISGFNRRSMIVSIAEGRGSAKGEVGLAAIDSNGSTIYLSQFPDGCTYSRLFTKLEIYDPIEIILPSSLPETGNKNLIELLANFNDKINLVKVERKFFNDELGWKCVQNLCHSLYQSKIEIETKDKYYCLSALSALVKYIEYFQNISFTSNSFKILYTGSEQTMLIDPITAKNLELIVNETDCKTTNTLLEFLDYTKTKGGYRLLRATIREPSCDIKTIEPRYDLIADLLADPELHFGLSEILSKFVDVDCLIFSIIREPKIKDWVNGEKKIDTCIYLKHILKLIAPLKELLKTATHSIFLHYSLLLEEPSFNFIAEEIENVINSDVKLIKGSINIKTQKCFAIKSEENGFLEAKREAYSQLREEINELLENVSSKYLLPIRLNYNVTRGYHFQLNLNEKQVSLSSLPSEFIRISRKGRTLSFTTFHLLKKSVHISFVLEEIFKESYEILAKLFLKIRDQVGCLYKLSEIIAFLDLILSFSCVSAKFNMTRPELGETLVVKSGIHPYLLNLKKDSIPNDIYLSQDSNIWIITGPNMSGKSTYLKQICLLQIMAQCGCFVPAKKASFRITNQIFSRIGSDDDLESNCSTFTLELKEAKYILENVTDLSLIIFDELGKGTAFEEGISLNWAIVESLVESKAFIIVATHFTIMCQLEWFYYNITNHHFQVDQNQDSTFFHFTYLLKDGINQISNYGIKLAEISSFPKQVIDLAKEKSIQIQNQVEFNRLQNRDSKILRLKYQIALHLIILASKPSLKKEFLPQYLKDLKIKYNQQLAKL